MGEAQARAGVYGRQSKDKTKSIDEQTAECEADAAGQGWTVAERYSDGVSASRFATKARKHWARLLADLDQGKLDILVLWESSRGDRDLPTWVQLLATCRERGVRIRITSHERTYDVRNGRDWKSLAEDGIDSAYESEKTSVRLKRAMVAQAVAGRPQGHHLYGYERVYGVDERGKRVLLRVRPHPSQAPIVAEIVARVGKGEPVLTICRDLEARGVPAPKGGRWLRSTVRDMAMRLDYLGKRELRGEVSDAIWPAVVTEADHLAARRVLGDRSRRASRPTRQKWLLSYLATCAVCGEGLHGRPARGPVAARYQCSVRGCASIHAAPLDDLVTEVVCRYLAADLKLRPPSNDAVVLAARLEAETRQTELGQWRESARRGETTPASLAHIEAGLLDDIKAAWRRAEQATTPPVMLDVIDGAHGRLDVIRARFVALPVAARRDIIASLLDVKILRATTQGREDEAPDPERVDIAWRTP